LLLPGDTIPTSPSDFARPTVRGVGLAVFYKLVLKCHPINFEIVLKSDFIFFEALSLEIKGPPTLLCFLTERPHKSATFELLSIVIPKYDKVLISISMLIIIHKILIYSALIDSSDLTQSVKEATYFKSHISVVSYWVQL